MGKSTFVKKQQRRISGVLKEVPQPLTLQSGKYFMTEADKRVFAENLRVATRSARSLLHPSQIRKIRISLGLSQRRASFLLGGGVRSFQKYEAGTAAIGLAMDNLLRLLYGNPKLLIDLPRYSEPD